MMFPFWFPLFSRFLFCFVNHWHEPQIGIRLQHCSLMGTNWDISVNFSLKTSNENVRYWTTTKWCHLLPLHISFDPRITVPQLNWKGLLESQCNPPPHFHHLQSLIVVSAESKLQSFSLANKGIPIAHK